MLILPLKRHGVQNSLVISALQEFVNSERLPEEAAYSKDRTTILRARQLASVEWFLSFLQYHHQFHPDVDRIRVPVEEADIDMDEVISAIEEIISMHQIHCEAEKLLNNDTAFLKSSLVVAQVTLFRAVLKYDSRIE